MKSKEKGDIAVGAAIAYYLSKQFEVFLPVGDKLKYDLIVDKDGELFKIQCKYTAFKSDYGIYQVPLRVMGGNQSYHTAKSYEKTDFNTLFAMTSEGDKYEIPFGIVTAKNSLSLGKKWKQYKV